VAEVTELRVALTVADFDEALRFYRDPLGLDEIAYWSSESATSSGRSCVEVQTTRQNTSRPRC
jgi:catechol 2,3-dioxygenase-like lactoylglutathione lyase family enzyme